MSDLSSFLVAGLTGFLSGFLLSIPVGPVNLAIMNDAAQHGFKRAALIGAGASGLETIYCAMAFSELANFFNERHVKAGMEIFTFAFLLFLGVKFLGTKDFHRERRGGLLALLRPKSGFMTGVVMLLGNPGVLLFWVILAVNFTNRGWVGRDWLSKGGCVLGVALGTGAWFAGLAYACSFGHKKFSDKTLLRMEHGSGICLVGLGLIHGAELVWQVANHKL